MEDNRKEHDGVCSEATTAAGHCDWSCAKSAHPGHLSRESSLPLPDIGTLRINADGRTASGATDSSHGGPEVGEEVESPPQLPLCNGWSTFPVAPTPPSEPRPAASSPVAATLSPEPVPGISPAAPREAISKHQGQSGCGLLALLFRCGNGSGSKATLPVSQPPLRRTDRNRTNSISGARQRGTSAVGDSQAAIYAGRPSSASNRKVSEAGSSYSRSKDANGARHREGPSAPVSSSKHRKHKSREGQHSERLPSIASKVGISRHSTDGSRRSTGHGRAVDVQLSRDRRRERRQERRRLRQGSSGASNSGDSFTSSIISSVGSAGTARASIASSRSGHSRSSRSGHSRSSAVRVSGCREMQRSDSLNSVSSFGTFSSISSLDSMSSLGSHGSRGSHHRRHSGGSSNGSTASNCSQRLLDVLTLESFGMEVDFRREGRRASAPVDMGFSGASLARSPGSPVRHSGRSGSSSHRAHESASFSPAAASVRYHSPPSESREKPYPSDHPPDIRLLAVRKDSSGRTSGEASEAEYSSRKSPPMTTDVSARRWRLAENGLEHNGKETKVFPDRMSGSKMEQLHDKICQQRAETERQLRQVSIVGAMQAGMQVGGQTPAAFLNLPHFQERRTKLLRRLEKLDMQQRRLERHLLEATALAGPTVVQGSRPVAALGRATALSGGHNPRCMVQGFAPPPANATTSLAGQANRGKDGHSSSRSLVVVLPDSPQRSGSQSTRNSRPGSGATANSGTPKRVTFGENSDAAPMDGLQQANAAMSSLKHMLSNGEADSSA